MTSTARRIVVAALLALAVASVVVAPTSRAQVLPDLPPLPAPPAEGNVAADVLGPASATACDLVATAFGLAGPIASAQLPQALQELLVEVDPYLALVTYACGYLVTPPSGVVCAPDQELTRQAGLLGLPVAPPEPTAILYRTAAGIEHAFLRVGADIGAEASRLLAAALGCGVPAEVTPPAAAPLPVPEAPAPAAPEPPPAGGLARAGAPALPSIPAVVDSPALAGSTTQLPGTVGQLGPVSYPVRAQAAVLLALPLVLLAGAVALEPRVHRGRRRVRSGPPRAGSAS